MNHRARLAACREAGVEPRFREFKGTSSKALGFVWSENISRRHLNPGQAAVAVAKRTKFDAEYAEEVEKVVEEARERKSEGGKAAGRGRPKKDAKQSSQAKEAGNSSRQRAKAAGTNRRYLAAAQDLLDRKP
jgi:hypothetical protein